MKTHREPLVIGWAEYVDLPNWGITGLRAKVDTGARSSALHVDDLREHRDGTVSFEVVLKRKVRKRHIRVRVPIARHGRVKSSNGHLAKRIFVETMLRLGDVEKTIEVSLVDREKMIHRMLLGRSALTGPLLIDVNHRVLLGKPKRKKRTAAEKRRPPS